MYSQVPGMRTWMSLGGGGRVIYLPHEATWATMQTPAGCSTFHQHPLKPHSKESVCLCAALDKPGSPEASPFRLHTHFRSSSMRQKRLGSVGKSKVKAAGILVGQVHVRAQARQEGSRTYRGPRCSRPSGRFARAPSAQEGRGSRGGAVQNGHVHPLSRNGGLL